MDVCGPEKERQTGDSWRTARRHPSHVRATSITAKRVRGVYSPRRGDEDTPDGWFGRAIAHIGAFLARPGARAHNFAIREQDVRRLRCTNEQRRRPLGYEEERHRHATASRA